MSALHDDGKPDPSRRRWLSAFSLCTMSVSVGCESAMASVGRLRGIAAFGAVAEATRSPSPGRNQRLVDLPERLAALEHDAQQLPRLRSLVVLHQGNTVFANAFRGPAVDQAVNIKSVSKSIVAALVGCAIERGLIENVQLTLDDSIPELLPANVDPRVRSLRLEHLLTMQAGLQRTSGPFYGRWISSDDWIQYVLTRPFVAEPGTRMLYSTGDWHVLGAVLANLTDKSLHTLVNQWIGEPLGIEFARWTRDPQGYYLGGNEMSLSPLNMARFGELYRTHGLWQKQRVFDESWVRQSFQPRTRSPFSGDTYGYGWFLRQIGPSMFAYARGYGGQFIHVIPDSEIVVAMTSDWTRAARGGDYTEQLHTLVTRHLLLT